MRHKRHWTLSSDLQTALLHWLTAQTAAVEPPSLFPSKHSRMTKNVIWGCVEWQRPMPRQTCHSDIEGHRNSKYSTSRLRSTFKVLKKPGCLLLFSLWTLYSRVWSLACLSMCQKWRRNRLSFLCKDAQELPWQTRNKLTAFEGRELPHT